LTSERILLILGNSVSMSPPEAANIPVTCYPDLLRERLGAAGWGVEHRSSSGAAVDDIGRTARQIAPELHPAAVVIQLGIVDCAPRPLRPSEREFLERIRPRLLRSAIVRFLHEFRATVIRYRGLIQRTEIASFEQHFRQLLEDCLAVTSRVAILPIFPATSSILARNPRLATEIDKYNAVMRSDPRAVVFAASEVFDGASIEALSVAPESVHLNQRGHELVAACVERWLRSAERVGTE
jgi:lysophospholipase L1-like esterase